MKPILFGCAGTALSAKEEAFFRATQPVGFILFKRNCETPEQIRTLVDALRDTVGRDDAPILIDQEGGRVARLGPPHWRSAPPMAPFGVLAARDRSGAEQAIRLNTALLAAELTDLGISVDCVPVLDVPAPDGHDIIGDRAFSADPATVARLGAAMVDACLANGIIPVIKHIPGHGRATADSHHDLPTVTASWNTLRTTDFVPFRANAGAPWAMTAHIVYADIDPDRPATLSPKVIDSVIRGEIGFRGVLITDDLSMRALRGSFEDRAKASLAAGCDLLLHCNGDMEEMRAVAAGATSIADTALHRLEAAEARRAKPATPPNAAEQARFMEDLNRLLSLN
jgi:beta-N-acetylhexosaminidase